MRIPSIPPNVLLVLAALGLGAAAYWGSSRYLSSQARETEQRLAGQYAPRAIVVAADDVPAGAVVDDAPMAARRVPSAYVPSDAVPADDVSQLAGRRIRVALKRGDPVTTSVLEDAGRPSLAAELATGMRAVTVPVDEAGSFAGLLEPGDLVDLVFTSEAAGRAADRMVRPLLQSVRVLATGRETRRTRLRDRSGNEREIEAPFSTVTVLASPRDAQRILLAQRAGSLHVLLRAPGDGAEAALQPLSAADLGGRAGVGRRRAGDALEVIVASQGNITRRTESGAD